MFKKTDDVRCENCVFWESYYRPPNREAKAGVDERQGFCHKHAPQAGCPEENDGGVFFPTTDIDQWCGEFQPAKA